LIHFEIKNTLKNNYYHNNKHYLRVRVKYFLIILILWYKKIILIYFKIKIIFNCNVKYTLDIKWFCLTDIPILFPLLFFVFFMLPLLQWKKHESLAHSNAFFFFFCVSFNFSLTSDPSLPLSHLVGNQNMRKNSIKNWTVSENIDAATSAGFAFRCNRWFFRIFK
jgi:hypothetical protein